MTKRGKCQMVIIDKAIVMIGRKWRSKWWRITCAGCRSRRRKDGTCKHERAVLECVNPEFLPRVRIGRA
jgi:hypothetical protein